MNTSKLRGVISERGYSQRQVAKALGISEKTFYSKIKTGKFGWDEVESLITFLDIENPCEIFLSNK